jgi:small subunit ribosomal protein S1
MSLGIKQLIPDPWSVVLDKYAKGTKHTATVRNFTNFGIFVELEEGVDGLIHISDLSWSKKIKHPSEFTKIGDQIDVVVLEIDVDNRKLSLGHKQLEENPWDVFETMFTVDSIHQGTIINVMEKGAIVSMPYGVEAFAPTRHLVKTDGTSAKSEEVLDFKILEFNKEGKKIIVSHSKINEEVTAADNVVAGSEKKSAGDDAKKSAKKVKDSIEKTTLGDMDVLTNLKADMEKTENQSKTSE